MSVLGDTIAAIKEAFKLTEDVKSANALLSDVVETLTVQDRRITRLETRWETAIDIVSARRAVRGAEDKN